MMPAPIDARKAAVSKTLQLAPDAKLQPSVPVGTVFSGALNTVPKSENRLPSMPHSSGRPSGKFTSTVPMI